MFNLLNKLKTSSKVDRPLALLILDGFGVAPASAGNPMSQAKMPTLDWLKASFPYGELIAAGEAVGLPANEAGNSEVGHLTIGAGRVIYQSLPRISLSIKDGSFFGNQALLSAVFYTRAHGTRLHLVGLISSGNVHSSVEHLFGLIELCKRNGVKGAGFHLFTDGRDAPPEDGVQVMESVVGRIAAAGVGRVATVMGRYYGMDRDGRWERTKRAYEAIVSGVGEKGKSAVEAIRASYQKNLTDEFVPPTVIVDDEGGNPGVGDGDAVILFNFRVDRARQLTMAFTMENFESLHGFEMAQEVGHGRVAVEKRSGPTFLRMRWPKNLFTVTMTQYQENIPVSAVAFPPVEVRQSLAEVLSERGLGQLHMSESEKERMVTFYFDGMREGKFVNEEVVIVPSPRVQTYDKKPEMSVFKLVDRFKKELRKDHYHFYVINFANPDMVAHSGDLVATVAALEAVDMAISGMINALSGFRGRLVITADHGNAEELLSYPSASFFYTTERGSINTEHSRNPVPIIVYDPILAGKPMSLPRGSLKDVAPTILAMMGIPKPDIMTGRSLI